MLTLQTLLAIEASCNLPPGKEFANVLRQVPTYAIWDDHDYGPNNSDGTAKGKSFPWLDGNRHGPTRHLVHLILPVPF